MKLGNPKTNADVQMSEAFVTSVFGHCPEVFRMRIHTLRVRKYFPTHRREILF